MGCLGLASGDNLQRRPATASVTMLTENTEAQWDDIAWGEDTKDCENISFPSKSVFCTLTCSPWTLQISKSCREDNQPASCLTSMAKSPLTLGSGQATFQPAAGFCLSWAPSGRKYPL